MYLVFPICGMPHNVKSFIGQILSDHEMLARYKFVKYLSPRSIMDLAGGAQGIDCRRWAEFLAIQTR